MAGDAGTNKRRISSARRLREDPQETPQPQSSSMGSRESRLWHSPAIRGSGLVAAASSAARISAPSASDRCASSSRILPILRFQPPAVPASGVRQRLAGPDVRSVLGGCSEGADQPVIAGGGCWCAGRVVGVVRHADRVAPDRPVPIDLDQSFAIGTKGALAQTPGRARHIRACGETSASAGPARMYRGMAGEARLPTTCLCCEQQSRGWPACAAMPQAPRPVRG